MIVRQPRSTPIKSSAASDVYKRQAPTGGDQSKFGLNSSELLQALELLEKHKMQQCLKLIHFHIGSQVTKIPG